MTDDLTRLLHRAAEELPDEPDRFGQVQRRRTALVRRRRLTAGVLTAAVAGAVAGVLLVGQGPRTESLVPATSSPTAADPASAAASPAPPSYAPISKADACPDLPAAQVPVDLTAIRAYLCTWDIRTVPGEGTWTVDVVKGVTGGLDELLTAFSVQDFVEPTGDVACTLDLPAPLRIWVHAPEPVMIDAPQGGRCNRPHPRAAAAYAALTTVVVSETRLGQSQSEMSVLSGCSDEYKDVLAEAEELTFEPDPDAVHIPLAPGSRVCHYEVIPGTSEPPIGRLTSTRVFTPAQLDDVNAQLAALEADPSCSGAGSTRFALLHAGFAQRATVVSLDGCAVTQEGGWWRSTPQLRASLS